jgi:hypothetical protein
MMLSMPLGLVWMMSGRPVEVLTLKGSRVTGSRMLDRAEGQETVVDVPAALDEREADLLALLDHAERHSGAGVERAGAVLEERARLEAVDVREDDAGVDDRAVGLHEEGDQRVVERRDLGVEDDADLAGLVDRDEAGVDAVDLGLLERPRPRSGSGGGEPRPGLKPTDCCRRSSP